MRRLALFLIVLFPLSAVAEEPKLLASLSPPRNGSGSWLAFTADGRTLAVGSTKAIWVWDTARWKLRKTFPYGAMSLAFSRDGRSLAIGSRFEQSYKALILELSTGRPRCTIAGRGVGQLALSPDGSLLAMGQDSALQLWDVASGKQRPITGGASSEPVCSLCFSPDGTLLAIGLDGGGIILWDFAANRQVAKLAARQANLMFSGDGLTLASQDGEKSAKTWDVKTRRERLKMDFGHPISGIALNNDGTMLALAGESIGVELLDAITGKHLVRLSGAETGDVAFSPDGKLLAVGGADNTVKVWKLPQLRR
jgi:dipeptidyl aminopeptidase/acylaminoacyl peptidase